MAAVVRSFIIVAVVVTITFAASVFLTTAMSIHAQRWKQGQHDPNVFTYDTLKSASTSTAGQLTKLGVQSKEYLQQQLDNRKKIAIDSAIDHLTKTLKRTKNIGANLHIAKVEQQNFLDFQFGCPESSSAGPTDSLDSTDPTVGESLASFGGALMQTPGWIITIESIESTGVWTYIYYASLVNPRAIKMCERHERPQSSTIVNLNRIPTDK